MMASNETHKASVRLATSGWLARTSPEFAAAILGLAQWRRYGAGETLVRGGAQQGDLLGLALGSVAARSMLGPADSPALHILTPPHWLGYAPMLNRRSRVLQCMARTPVLVAQLHQAALKQLLEQNPGYWEYMALLAFESLEAVLNIATDLSIRNSRRRCAAALLRIAGCRFENAPAPAVALASQDELCGVANVARSTLNPILGDFEAEGLISRGYNQVLLHDIQALRAVADG